MSDKRLIDSKVALKIINDRLTDQRRWGNVEIAKELHAISEEINAITSNQGESARLREAIKEAMQKEWELAGEPTPVYTILHQALSNTEDKLSFSGEWDFKPGINTEE